MKQVIHSMRSGDIRIVEAPAPQPGPTEILVRNRASIISAGTERAVLQRSPGRLLRKSLAHPDLVSRLVFQLKGKGFISTFEAARARLNSPTALGYSSAGEVTAIGSLVTEFRVGDRVACAGGGWAVHAETVRVPRTLAAQIPSASTPGSVPLSFEEAAFAAVGSIALHGLRLAGSQVAETVAVIGLGLVGQIAVQLARASGCHVIGMDPNSSRCELARKLGCEGVSTRSNEFRTMCAEFTRGIGADAVLIAASTESSEPLAVAGEIARERARVISIGLTGTRLPRSTFYRKELEFKVSRSCGPGRYDAEYEERGRDYPVGYVRWTEGRNLAAVLELMTQQKIDVKSLISHRFDIESAEQAYEVLKSSDCSMGIVICYPGVQNIEHTIEVNPIQASTPSSDIRVGLMGAGNYAKSTLLPAIARTGNSELISVCTTSGISAGSAAALHGFRFATTDAARLFGNSEINTVVICTRHRLHASQVVTALESDKHVFCEKPLCINESELRAIAKCYSRSGQRRILMVGFNRRFSPMVSRMKAFFENVREPLVMNYRVNAGFLPRSHWTQDPEQGGGRLIGEVCHFVDLMSYLCNSSPVQVFASAIPDSGRYQSENLTMQITFGNGSAGVITYIANGSRQVAKERLEVFGQGKTAVLDDFRQLALYGDGHRRVTKSWLRVDKGHSLAWRAMEQAIVSGGPSPIPFSEIVMTTLATFRAVDSIHSGKPEIVQFCPEEQSS